MGGPDTKSDGKGSDKDPDCTPLPRDAPCAVDKGYACKRRDRADQRGQCDQQEIMLVEKR